VPDNFSLTDFLHGNNRRAKVLFFLAGALLTLSFAPFGWYLLAPFLLLPLLQGFLVSRPRTAAAYGFWFGAGLFLAGTYWLYISIHVFGEAPLILAIFLMLALVVIMGLYYAAAGWLTARLCDENPLRLLVVAPSVWVAIEWIRGWFLSGFPWMSLGYGQVDSPLAGLAPLLGVYGISLAVMFSATALIVLRNVHERLRWPIAVAALLPWVCGYLLQGIEWTEEAGAPVRTTIVQGGVSQDRKWLPEQFQPTLAYYRNTLQENPDSQLIVWPEVAIPSVLDLVDDYVEALQTAVKLNRQTLLFGILERDLRTEVIYNSVVLLNGTDRQIYRKRHLVPFGEFFPVPDFVREWMRLMSLPNSDISPGDAVQPLLQTLGGQKLSVAICYEDAYGAEQLYALPDASILINVSNDAWFGDSIAPYQHLEIARMRAVEVGRPVVRATNTGISTFISADGELSGTVAQFTAGTATQNIVPRQGLTPYARFGNVPSIGLVLIVIAGFAWREYAIGRNQSNN
jgi:apolipoprotein N-acyltransferase